MSAVIDLFSGSKHIKLEQKIDEFQLDIKHTQSLGIVINELITNVMKYAFKGRDSGLIRISLLKNKDIVTLTVHDNGIGLPDDFNLNKSIGLGLMLVSMLTEQLGGSFNLINDNGTRSVVKFKLNRAFSAKTSRTKSESGGTKTKNPVILVADDLPVNRALIKSNIIKLFPDAAVIEAENGKDAVDLVNSQRIDLIFMDLQMPVLDGIKAAEKIRQNSKNSHNIPVIGFSADDSDSEKERCLKAGMDDFLLKPLDAEKIKKAFAAFLNIHICK